MKYLNQFLAMCLVTLGLFVLLNAVALFFIPEPPPKRESAFFIDMQSEQGQQINAKVQGVEDRAVLRSIMEPPGLRPNPVLHFGEGSPSPQYSVSLEGVRKDPGWSDEFLGDLLTQTGQHTFVMGGSTTFGHGVKDADTLVAFLNHDAADTGSYFINFGTQSYDSVREIQKLNNLLSKGMRPQRVIFLDGLNDISTRWRCPYQLQDCYRHYNYVGGIPTPSLRSQLLWKLPIVQALMPQPSQTEWEALIDEEPNPYLEPAVRQEMAIPPSSAMAEQLADRLVADYLTQLAYLRTLAQGFDFELVVFIHPIVFLQRDNPFVLPEFFADDSYLAWDTMFRRFREALSQEPDVYDCADAITEPELAFVDASHFSGRGAAQLAACMERALQQPPQLEPEPEEAQ